MKKNRTSNGKGLLTWVWNVAYQPVQLLSPESLVAMPIASNDMRSIFEYSCQKPVETD
jgi:hypothetical protein